MKNKLILAIFLLPLFAVSSCKKDSSTPSTLTYQIEGLWIGTFTVDNAPSQPGTYYYSYAIYPDGSILVKSKGADGNNYYSTGVWSLSSSNVFSATITTINFPTQQITQTLTANYSNSGKMTDGIWVDTVNENATGKLSMMRVN